MSENAGAAGAAGAVGVTIPVEHLLMILPEELVIDPKLNIRGASFAIGDLTDDELRASIVKDGQLQPILGRMNGDGKVSIIAGHRRVEQIAIANMEKAEDVAPIKVAVMVRPMTDDQAWTAAWAENKKRRNMNAIEEANYIAETRARFGLKGSKGSAKVALMMGVSPAWITEREKLLKLDESVQARVRSGELSADAALVLPRVVEGKVGEVIADARVRQDQENASKGKGKGGAISRKNLAAAARETEGALSNETSGSALTDAVVTATPGKKKKKAKKPASLTLSKAEIIDFFDSYRDGVPFLYESVQAFIVYFVDSFVKGEGTIRTMEAKFEAMIAASCKGPKMELKPEPEAPKKPAKVAKPAKVKTPKTPKAAKPAKKKAPKKLS
jgi:ParB/RepB/Spo0J family partition protein